MPTRAKAVVLCATGATDVKPGGSASIEVAVRQSGSTGRVHRGYNCSFQIKWE